MNFISLIGLVIYKTRYICNAICRRYERTLFRKVGSGTSIGEGGIFTYSTISIGKKCHIGKYACLQSAHGEIIIQDNVMLGPFVSIHGGNHVYDNIGVFMNSVKKEKGTDGKVIIKDNSWLGANSVILKDVVVNRGTVVAAGAVVSKSTAPYSIVGGVPAIHIKFYWTIDQIMEHEAKLYEPNERYTREELEQFFDSYCQK